MFFSQYFSAVPCVTATSLESVNGVGGNAVMPLVGEQLLGLLVGGLRVVSAGRPRPS